MQEAVKSDGTQYWEYVLLCVDDCLVVSKNGEKFLRNEICKYFTLKEASIGPPKVYLWGNMSLVELANGTNAWAFSSSQYVQEEVQNVESYLKEQDFKLPARSGAPFSPNYRPEIGETLELEPGDAAYYKSLIGILRWIVDLGRVDVCTEVSLLAKCLFLPWVGHQYQVFHVFTYLKKHRNTEMVFDPYYPKIDQNQF